MENKHGTAGPRSDCGQGDDPREFELTDRRYRALVEQLPLVSYASRLNEGSAFISPQISALVGYSAAEWVADPDFFARVLHPDDRAWVLAGFAAMHMSGKGFECEYRLIARSGEQVWIHDAAVVIADDTGHSTYAQGYMIDITARKRAEAALLESQAQLRKQFERLEYQALHDALTDLPNRLLFHDRTTHALLQARRDNAGLAVIMIELDRFDELSETLGHPTSELLLVEVAKRLRGQLRKTDTVARLGGHRFAVLAPRVSSPGTAMAVAKKVRGELLRPVVAGGMSHEIEAAIGIALYPQHGSDVETLIQHADVGVHTSKSTYLPTLYTEKNEHRSLARLELGCELRKALDEHELVVMYQPQIDVGSGEVRKVEALVRWQHPRLGLLAPDLFIPLAEQSGLIRALTRQVLDTALSQLREWHDAGRELTVAVNITGRELVDLRFPDEVAELLEKWSVDPSQLELEITERTIMNDLPRSRSILMRLSELGVRIAMDDFGSGQSSLAYLRGLPLTVLKIDKSFVQHMTDAPRDAALVQMAIDLGHNLGLEVVAEGVETEEVTRCLDGLGCDTLQGYHFGRPEAAAAISRRLARQRVRHTPRRLSYSLMGGRTA